MDTLILSGCSSKLYTYIGIFEVLFEQKIIDISYLITNHDPLSNIESIHLKKTSFKLGTSSGIICNWNT